MSYFTPLHIVVTDINHNVRDFLGRELAKEGYAVVGVKSAKSATEKIYSSLPLDIIILDPELFACFDQLFVAAMVGKRPSLQIIVHTYADSFPALLPAPQIHLVEKNGQSIGTIKSILKTFDADFYRS